MFRDLPLNLSTTPPQTPAGMSGVTITASPAKRCRLLTGEYINLKKMANTTCTELNYTE